MEKIIQSIECIKGNFTLPGDETLGACACLIASLFDGETQLKNLPVGNGFKQAVELLTSMGISINTQENLITVTGSAYDIISGISKPVKLTGPKAFQAGAAGFLAIGDAPRIVTVPDFETSPVFKAIKNGLCALDIPFECDENSIVFTSRSKLPEDIRIKGDSLLTKTFVLAALLSEYCSGNKRMLAVSEENLTSSPLEDVLPAFGISIKRARPKTGEDADMEELIRRRKRRLEGTSKPIRTRLSIRGKPECTDGILPGDGILGMCLCAACEITGNSKIQIDNITFSEPFKSFGGLLTRMGAKIELTETGRFPFNTGKFSLSSSPLRNVSLNETALLQSEIIPILIALTARANGEFIIPKNASYSSDLAFFYSVLKEMGAVVGEFEDGLVFKGGYDLQAINRTCSGNENRAMGLFLLGLGASGSTVIEDWELIQSNSLTWLTEILENSQK